MRYSFRGQWKPIGPVQRHGLVHASLCQVAQLAADLERIREPGKISIGDAYHFPLPKLPEEVLLPLAGRPSGKAFLKLFRHIAQAAPFENMQTRSEGIEIFRMPCENLMAQIAEGQEVR